MDKDMDNTSGNWALYYTDDGIPYWHDHTTGESIWANKEDIEKSYETSAISATNYYGYNSKSNIGDDSNNDGNDEDNDDNDDDDEEEDDEEDDDENFEKGFKAFLTTVNGREAMENELAKLEKEFGNRVKKSIKKLTRQHQTNNNDQDENNVEFGAEVNTETDDDNAYSDDSISTDDSDVQEIMEPVLVVPNWMPYYPTIMEKLNTYTTRFTLINGAREVFSTSTSTTPAEMVINTSVACISTSSRLINGTKNIILNLFSTLLAAFTLILSFMWTRIDNIIKTHTSQMKKKSKKKKTRNDQNDDL